MSTHITPAILESALSKIKKEAKAVGEYSSLVQVDIIDGKFAPAKTILPSALRNTRLPCVLEFHLMVEDPGKYVDDCFHAHARQVLFHLESCTSSEVVDLVTRIKRRKMRPGLVLSPGTPAAKLKPYLKIVDLVQVMTVYPGKQGQRFLFYTLKKVRQVRRMAPKIEIAVDGGITGKTAPLAIAAGADRLVVGSALFKTRVPLISLIELCEQVSCRL